MVRRNILLHPGFIHTKRSNRRPQEDTRKIRVLLAHGSPLLGEGVRRLLNKKRDIDVVGQARRWPEVAERCCRLAPHVLVMDITLCATKPGRLTELLNHQPVPRILLLASSLKEAEVREAVRERAHGILGDCDSAQLARSICALHHGEDFFSAEVVSLMAGEPGPPRGLKRPRLSLTAGEGEVLRLVAQGMSNRQIAEALSLSSKTVRNRLSLLFRKLRVRNRTEAALHALRQGLVNLDGGE